LSVLGYFLHGIKSLFQTFSKVTLVLLSGTWVCGLSSLYPLVNLGKLHSLSPKSLSSSLKEPHNGSSKTTSASYPRIFNWTKNLVASRSHLQDSLGSRRSFGTEILSTLILLSPRQSNGQTTIESNSDLVPTNLTRNYQCTTKNSHCQKRDEGITSRHCGVAKGSQFSARSLESDDRVRNELRERR
jgi:hypothetical protein